MPRELLLRPKLSASKPFSLKASPYAPLTKNQPSKELFKKTSVPGALLKHPAMPLLNPVHSNGAYRKYVEGVLKSHPPATRANIAALFRKNYRK